MKLQFKKLIQFTFLLGLIFCPPKASALNSLSAGEIISYSRYNMGEELPSGLDKSETVCVKGFEFPGELSKCDFKHLKVVRDIVFVERSSKETVASIVFEVNFRYNENTRHAQCLSCYHDSKIFNNSYTAKTFSRPANKNTELGSALMRYELKDLNNKIFNESKEVDEDYKGKIQFQSLEKFNV